MTDPTLELHKQELTRLRRLSGWVALIGPWLFGVTALAIDLAYGMGTLTVLGLFFFLQAAVLIGFWSTLKWRQRAFLRRLEDPAADTGSVYFLSRFMPYLSGLLAIALPLMLTWEVFGPRAELSPDIDATWTQLFAWGFVAMAILSALFAQYFSAISPELAPEARGVACWFRAGTWMALVGAVSLFIVVFNGPWGAELTTSILLGIVLFLGAELTLRALWTSWLQFYNRVPHPGARVGTDLFSLRLLFSRFNPSGSLFAVLADVFGIDLRGAWALTFMRRSLLPLAAGLFIIGWLSTSFVMIGPADVGLVERFGKLDREPLKPGLHLGLPWPMQRVNRIPVHRVQTIPIGFAGSRQEASMLWTVAHAEEEYKLLLGDGRDLVTVNATLHYRIGDPFAYAYSLQNPDDTLAILADRVLMQRTVGRTLDGVLSENLAALGEELELAIQGASNDRNLGFEIVDLTLTGLHPPVNVGADYQAVVAARIDQTTKLLKAETYRELEYPRADGATAKLKNGALAHSVTRLSNARGEATAFQALRASYLASPEVFGLIRHLQAVEAGLAGKRFHVIDHTIEESGGAIWIREEQ